MQSNKNPYKSWINKTVYTKDIVTTQLAQKMNAILDHNKTIREGDLLPPAWHWLYANPIFLQSKLGNDGHAIGGEFLPPVALQHRLWAGSFIKFLSPICFGDYVQRRTQIKHITPSYSQNGKMRSVSIILQHDIVSNTGGKITEIQNILYQKNPPKPKRINKSSPHRKSDFLKKITLDSTMLFRFSAITFNSHRIHYDYPYATQEEGYNGLVVQGPLIALMLLNCLQQNHPHLTLSSFEFIPQYPTTLPLTISLRGRCEGNHYILWADDHGSLICLAKAQLNKNNFFKKRK